MENQNQKSPTLQSESDPRRQISGRRTKVKTLLFWTLSLLFFLFLIINIVFSQNISSLFVGMVNNQRQAVVDYLKRIKVLPQFKKELVNYQEIYGHGLTNEVFKDERLREEKIAELESILQKNNQARDVLYDLYLLYKAEGNNDKAQSYLNKAKEIDPSNPNDK